MDHLDAFTSAGLDLRPNLTPNMHSQGVSLAVAAAASEDWTKLADRSSRRRIQNRISQRNRRKNLKCQQAAAAGPATTCSASRPGSSRSIASVPSKPEERHEPDPPQLPVAAFELIQPYRGDAPPSSTAISPPPNSSWLFSLQTSPIPSTISSHVMKSDPSRQTLTPQSHPDYGVQYHSPISQPESEFLAKGDEALPISPGKYPPALDNEGHATGQGGDQLYVGTQASNTMVSMIIQASKHGKPHIDQDLRGSPLQDSWTESAHEYLMLARSGSTSSHGSSSQGPRLRSDIYGYTGLHLAAARGHLGILRMLLDFGLAINSRNDDAQSALHLAVARGDAAITRFLLERGADANIRDAAGRTPLHVAALHGHTPVVALLLLGSHSGDGGSGGGSATTADERDFNGRTPFHCAVAEGHEDIVRLLLDGGIDAQAKIG